MIYVAFSPITMYIRGFDSYNRIHRDVCISPNPFGVFLDMDLTHLTPGIPYALRSLGFDLSYPFESYIRNPLVH